MKIFRIAYESHIQQSDYDPKFPSQNYALTVFITAYTKRKAEDAFQKAFGKLTRYEIEEVGDA